MTSFYHRNFICPAWVCELQTTGQLGENDLSLLMVIDSFSDPKGPGCFASNSYLAQILGIKSNTIPRIISRLKRIGTIRCEYYDGNRRVIRTAWSLAPNDPFGTSKDSVQTSGMYPPYMGGYVSTVHTYKKEEIQREEKNKSVDHETCLDRSTGKGEPVLIEGLTKVTIQSEPTQFDLDCSNKLKDLVNRHSGRTPVIRIKEWSKQFAALRETDNTTKESIVEILDWFAGAIGGEYIPVVLCAKSFRQKFGKLVEAKRRSTKASNLPLNELIPTDRQSDVWKKIVASRGNFGAQGKELEQAYLISCANLEQFRSKVADFALKGGNGNKRLIKFAERVLSGCQVLPKSSAERTMAEYILTLWDWTRTVEGGFKGKLSNLVWKVDGKQATIEGQKVATDYGWPDGWNLLLKHLEN